MKLKQRKLLTKIQQLHNELNEIILLSCGDKKYHEIQKKYSDYHNAVNFEILKTESEKDKQ